MPVDAELVARPGALPAGGHPRSRRSSSACSARRSNAARDRARSSPSIRAVPVVRRSGARLGPRRRARDAMTASRRMQRSDLPAHHGGDAEQPRSAARLGGATARLLARSAAATCSSPARTSQAPRWSTGCYDARGLVREDRWPRLARQLSRLGLHARLGPRRRARQGARGARRGARRAGVHLAGARRGLPPRRRSVHSAALLQRSEAARPLRDHAGRAGRCMRQGAAGARRRHRAAAIPAQGFSREFLLQEARQMLGSRSATAFRSSSTTTSSSRSRSARTACTSGAKTAICGAARKKLKASCSAPPATTASSSARAAVAAGADYVAFGSVFSSPTKPGAVRAPLSLFEKRACRRPACRDRRHHAGERAAGHRGRRRLRGGDLRPVRRAGHRARARPRMASYST